MPYIRGLKCPVFPTGPWNIMTSREIAAPFDIEMQFADDIFPEVYPLLHPEPTEEKEDVKIEGIMFILLDTYLMKLTLIKCFLK